MGDRDVFEDSLRPDGVLELSGDVALPPAPVRVRLEPLASGSSLELPLQATGIQAKGHWQSRWPGGRGGWRALKWAAAWAGGGSAAALALLCLAPRPSHEHMALLWLVLGGAWAWPLAAGRWHGSWRVAWLTLALLAVAGMPLVLLLFAFYTMNLRGLPGH